jgi:O-antigen/teichoic acid export membrane protein
MNKYMLSGVFVLIFIIGLTVIFNNQSVSLDDVFRGISDMNPRVMSILALPIIAALFGVGVYYHKKSEERMWKNALKQTRAKSDVEKIQDK